MVCETASGSPSMPDVVGHFVRTVHHVGHILQKHGRFGKDPHNQIPQLPRIGKRFTRFDLDQLITLAE